MLSSIHPLGERGRRNRFAKTAGAFVLGSVIGGALIGGIAGLAGWAGSSVVLAATGEPIPPRLSLLMVALAGAIAVGFDLSGRSLPSVHRQVNEDWLTEFRGWVYGFGFGVQLGAGITTYITSAAVLVWLVAMLVTGSVITSVLIGSVFGLVRGLSILAARSIESPDQLVTFHRSLHRSAANVRRVSSVALVILTTGAAFGATGVFHSA